MGVERGSRLTAARIEWDSGERRLERLRRDPAHPVAVDDVVIEIRRELTRRLGQTYTLADVLTTYEGSARWCRDIAQRVAPDVAMAHQLGLVADPVFAAAARGASDWRP